ncbi:magnesium transporter [Hypnocyclicus thermotrophus]|uniref:Magnesium transporter MgtE n=1 Tax=Hypnocyclicus thermotrophus TaxID=1627895 RepID=A0AA46DZH2_9FUSO|nr:magnesium transporter [Hypnocyclicus thermotrophus]TDT71822.1 magnesium transporter [Hypnocyclicus thermotrophus]
MDIKQVKQLIEEKKYVKLKEELEDIHEVNISEILKLLDSKEALLIYRLLSKDIAAEVFSYLDPDDQEKLINGFTDVEIKDLIEELYWDDMIDLIEEMPASIVKKILKNSNAENRKLINHFLNYPEDSAGSLMTIEYISLYPEMTVKESLDYIRSVGNEKETIYTSYILDKGKKLLGTVSLKELILAEPNIKVKEIANEDVISVYTTDDQELIAEVFKKYDLITVPVIDKEGRMVGIITIDDIVDVIEEETTEDIQKMAAITPLEEKYLDIGPIEMAKKRIPWLAILMISASLTSAVISRYESILAQMTVLSSFMPLLSGTSGNAGSQVSALIIRGLSLGNIKLKDLYKVIWNEFRTSIIIGIVLAIINFFRLYYLEIALVGNPEKFRISLLVSISLMFTIIMSKIVGGILPIAVKSIKLDPALMASPLLTTIIDVMSLIVYFNLVHFFFNI